MSAARGADGREGTRPARAPWIVTVVPLLYVVLLAAGSAVATWVVRDDLPARIAVHWGAEGTPDRFAGITEVIVTNSGILLAVPLFLLGLGVAVRKERSMAAISSGMATFLVFVVAGSVLAQRGATDAAEAGVTQMIWLGMAAGLAVGGLVWWVFRRKPEQYAVAFGPLTDGALTLRVSPTTRVAWTGHTRVTWWTWAIVALALIPMLVSGVVFALKGNWSDAALMLVLGFAVSVLVLSSVYTRVIIDARGVRVRGAGIVSWVNLPLSHLQGAMVTSVDPMDNFGGYGKRVSFDAKLEGMVTSKGEAILLHRADERPMVVTIDDAHRAAATLNTLLLRHRTTE
ncbi:MAG: DUF1648 domain-containing protein [Tessaracoccus sp.]